MTDTPKDEPKVEAAPVVTAAAPKEKPAPEKPELMMSFDRYFAHTGKPAHHKLGMRAFLDKRGGARGKRTVSAWKALFANY